MKLAPRYIKTISINQIIRQRISFLLIGLIFIGPLFGANKTKSIALAQSAIPMFAEAANFNAGTAPASVARADFNGDGKQDLAVANGQSSNVSVLLNTTPTGASIPTFATAVNFAVGLTIPSVPGFLSVADFNGDGKPDLAVPNFNNGTVSILLNMTVPGSTIPAFTAASDFFVPSSATCVVTGDFNNDGRSDLAATDFSSGKISVLINTTAPGATTATFATAANFTVGSFPFSIAVNDFNGDGKLDLAVANNGSQNLSILTNTTTPGAASPTFAPVVNFNAGNHPVFVASVDFNSDGRPDLAVINDGIDTVSVMLNGTSPGATIPGFGSAVSFATGSAPESVTVADLNRDGTPDLAVTNLHSNNISVLFNTTFPGATVPAFASAANFNTGHNPEFITSGDFNGDGKLDLATANGGDNNVSVLLNNTNVGMSLNFAPTTNFPDKSDPVSVALGDFNGDGKIDLGVLEFDFNKVDVMLNTSIPFATTPTFTTPTSFSVGGSSPRSVTVGDFNRDGKPDLAVANQGTFNVSILLNTTATGSMTPTFVLSTSQIMPSDPYSVAVGDFNGDGAPDVAVANSGTKVSVLINNTAPGAATANFAAAVNFEAGINPRSVAVGDFNGDGKQDLAVASAGSNNVLVLLNTTSPGAATPTFAPAMSFPVGDTPISVGIGDFNGDGKPDLAVVNVLTNNCSVLLNATAPGAIAPAFSTATNFNVGRNPLYVAVSDLNGDGIADVAVANQNSGNISVLLNTTAPGGTTPKFSPTSNLDIGNVLQFIAMADLNGDGKQDLITTDNEDRKASVLLNASGFGPPRLAIADINGGAPPIIGNPFSVIVEAHNINGSLFIVSTDTVISLKLETGTGTLAGTTMGTIPSGKSSVTISGLTYSEAETGVRITADEVSGDFLIIGESSPFTVNNPTPTISSLNPASVPQNSGNVTLTINGSGFLSASEVQFNGNSRVSTFVNNSKLMLALSSADLATVGTNNIAVINPLPGGGQSNIVNFNVVCDFIISPATKSFLPAGGSDTVTVTTGNECSWTATTNDSWIHITNIGSGLGNGVVNYSVDPNVSFNLRTGTITIADQNLTVAQMGVMSGDANGDQVVNVSDLLFIANILAGNNTPTPSQRAAADVLQDGKINVQDLFTLANFLAGNIHSLPLTPTSSVFPDFKSIFDVRLGQDSRLSISAFDFAEHSTMIDPMIALRHE